MTNNSTLRHRDVARAARDDETQEQRKPRAQICRSAGGSSLTHDQLCIWKISGIPLLILAFAERLVLVRRIVDACSH
jgi:hypothetical protein